MIQIKGLTQIELNVNSELRTATISPEDTLLRVIRESLGLIGPKVGCENGDCGACTVLLDGKPVKSCMMLALDAVGKEIVTVEGLNDTLIQEAFVEYGGFQCGYCTSGFLMNAYAMLDAVPDADETVKSEWLSSNLCRCTGYEGIKKAVAFVQKSQKNK